MMVDFSNSTSEQAIDTVVEHFFRHEYGKTVASLTRKYGPDKIEWVEDAVQEALLKAMKAWGFGEVPKNPSGWIYRVAKNHLIDLLRRGKKQSEWDAATMEKELGTPDAVDPRLPGELADDQLRMIFACCHPDLSTESQVILTLKLLCGFGNLEISRALLKSQDAVSKALTRGKKKFKSSVGALTVPVGSDLQQRLQVVAKIIYVLFNEGYNATQGADHIQQDLCEEAIRLGNLLVNHPHCNQPEINALMALMCFQASRLGARLDIQGNLLTLKDQDRSLWDVELIQVGSAFLAASSHAENPSEYHFQAGIAFYHCEATTFETTNWEGILGLYNQLVHHFPSPIAQLNRLVPLAKVQGPSTALAQLLPLEQEPRLAKYYLLYVVKADLYSQLNNPSGQRECLEKALILTKNETERMFLKEKLA